MANTKSARKNARKAKTRMLHNRQAKSRIKKLERQFEACLEANDGEAARKASAAFISALDRAAKSSIIHQNKANRKKSTCSKKLSLVMTSSPKASPEPSEKEAPSEKIDTES